MPLGPIVGRYGLVWAGNDLFGGRLALNLPAVGRWWGAVGWLSRDAGRKAQQSTSTAIDGLADMVVPTGAQPRKFYRVQLPDAIRLTILEDLFKSYGFSVPFEV